jgi:hypothetical protein
MGREADWPPAVSPTCGHRGSVVHLTLVADGLETATDLAMTGAGVTVRGVAGSGRGRLEASVTIAFDAPPGWRDIEVVLDGSLRRLPRAFEIVGPAAYYGGGRRGIGSHLI